MSDVLFPIVGRGETSLATVRCDSLDPKDYPAGRALVLARDEREIERILADSRSVEPTGAEIGRPIWVRFIPQQFSGRSYGLALALADKLARYRRDQAPDDRRIFATGIVVEDGSGRIGEVEAFDAKLAVIFEDARPGDIVVMPSANLDQASCNVRQKLACLEENGVVCRGIDHLDQLGDLYGVSQERPTAASPDDRFGQDRLTRQSPAAAATIGPSTSTGVTIGSGAADPSKAEIPGSSDPAAGRWLRAAAMTLAGLAIGAAAFTAGGLLKNDGVIASTANEARKDDADSKRNFLANASFEQGDGQQPVGWLTYSRELHDDADRVVAGGIDGSLVLEHGGDEAFYVDTHQVLHLPNGHYTFSAWIDSDGPKKANRMYARGDDLVEIDIPVTAQNTFEPLRIDCIVVTKGRLVVGFYTDVHHASRTAYDGLELVRNPRAANGRDCAA